MKLFLAFALSVGTVIGVGDASATRPELYSCSKYLFSTSGYTKCTAGTGLQRSRLGCYNGVDTAIEYGDWVGRGAASWEECNHYRSAVSISVDHP